MKSSYIKLSSEGHHYSPIRSTNYTSIGSRFTRQQSHKNTSNIRMRTQPNESSSDAPSLSMKVILKRHKYRLGMPNTARIINQSYQPRKVGLPQRQFSMFADEKQAIWKQDSQRQARQLVNQYPEQSSTNLSFATDMRTSNIRKDIEIVTQKSSNRKALSPTKILSYGISTFKGTHCLLNTHHIGIHLGNLKHFMLLQGYDGMYASNYLKKQYPVVLLGMIQHKQISVDRAIKMACEQVQNRLTVVQLETQENSGCTLSSLVIDHGIVYAANCGNCQILCMTRGEQFLALTKLHCTHNQHQLERIIQHGGTVYRTEVNLPYEKVMGLKGPLRLYPSGLIYTRTLGRALDFEKHAKMNRKTPSKRAILNPQSAQSLSAIPEVQYISQNQVQWIVVMSHSVIVQVSHDTIRNIVNKQMRKRSSIFTEHHIAEQCSRQIVLHAVGSGCSESLSVIVLLFEPVMLTWKANNSSRQTQCWNYNTQERIKPMGKEKSLKYVGNRKSFICETQ